MAFCHINIFYLYMQYLFFEPRIHLITEEISPRSSHLHKPARRSPTPNNNSKSQTKYIFNIFQLYTFYKVKAEKCFKSIIQNSELRLNGLFLLFSAEYCPNIFL